MALPTQYDDVVSWANEDSSSRPGTSKAVDIFQSSLQENSITPELIESDSFFHVILIFKVYQ